MLCVLLLQVGGFTGWSSDGMSNECIALMWAKSPPPAGVAGIAVGVVVFICSICVIAYCIFKKRGPAPTAKAVTVAKASAAEAKPGTEMEGGKV